MRIWHFAALEVVGEVLQGVESLLAEQ